MKPVIGITSAFNLKENKYFLSDKYVNSIIYSGGLPITFPYLDELEIGKILDLADGLLLSGGGDIDPFHFGEEPLPGLGEIDPKRDFFEIKITQLALSRNIPILAICRGVQILNIAAGGTIYQDIDSQVKVVLKHSQKAPRWHPTHNVRITENSILESIVFNQNIRVNSFHHQSIDKVAPGFVVNAVSEDNIIEGIESAQNSFVVGVQWHPEWLAKKDIYSQKLFTAFIEAAGRKNSANLNLWGEN